MYSTSLIIRKTTLQWDPLTPIRMTIIRKKEKNYKYSENVGKLKLSSYFSLPYFLSYLGSLMSTQSIKLES